jgi:hypothetical protein
MNRVSGWGFKTALLLAAACWGIGTVMSKGVLDHVPPLTLLVIQLAANLISRSEVAQSEDQSQLERLSNEVARPEAGHS